MKRVLLLVVAFMATLATSAENLADKLYANPDLIFSAYRTYIEPCEKIAKAPKGYKPCGMTVYARHGSRYDVDTISLHRAAKALRLAEKEGILTPFGKEVKNFIDEIKTAHGNHTHELSELGYEQHRNIAHRAYKNFPELFRRGATVKAASSLVLRCIFSMNSFGEGLKEMEPTLRFSPRAGDAEQVLTRPNWQKSPLAPSDYATAKKYRVRGPWYDVVKEWGSKQKHDASLSHIVTDVKRLREITRYNDHTITMAIAKSMAFSANYHTSGIELVRRFLTAEDMLLLHKHDNYRWNEIVVNVEQPIVAYNLLRCKPMMEDIIENGNNSFEGKADASAYLRFTHDSYTVPIGLILGMEGYKGRNTTVDDAHKVISLSDRLCMAMNYQFVFYHNKEGKRLVRVLLNEQDLLLPIEGAEGPFYEWQTFCNHIRAPFVEIENSLKK